MGDRLVGAVVGLQDVEPSCRVRVRGVAAAAVAATYYDATATAYGVTADGQAADDLAQLSVEHLEALGNLHFRIDAVDPLLKDPRRNELHLLSPVCASSRRPHWRASCDTALHS